MLCVVAGPGFMARREFARSTLRTYPVGKAVLCCQRITQVPLALVGAKLIG
jgi:hypothetical protein